MSREVKFRAWDPRERFMEDDQTAKFWLSQGFDKHTEKPVYFMQYTGLKDKNGVEIYEGDIVKAKHDDGRYDVGEVVYGSRGAFCLHLPNVATGIKTPLLNYIHGMMFAEYDIEVIGNIYENPELLKAA